MKARALALVVFTAASVFVSAQTPVANPSGHWKGSIEVPGMPAEFEIDIARDPRGALTGTVTFGAEHVTLPHVERGTLSVGTREMRLLLTIEHRPDGTSIARQ